jgi:hypothetical protein
MHVIPVSAGSPKQQLVGLVDDNPCELITGTLSTACLERLPAPTECANAPNSATLLGDRLQ